MPCLTPLDLTHDYADPSLYRDNPSSYVDDTITIQAPGFSNSPARGLDFAPSNYIHPSLYRDNAAIIQAPVFSNSPARGLDLTSSDNIHPFPYMNNTVVIQAPGFSNSPARGLDFAPSGYTRPPLYDVAAQEVPSVWSDPFVAGQYLTSIDKPDNRLDYTSMGLNLKEQFPFMAQFS